MAILANPKHEAFAQGLANRLDQIDAYESAGYPRSPSSASQLANREELRNRVLEIIEDKQRAAESRAKDDITQPPELSFAWLVKMLQKNIELAQSGGQISAANKAIEMLAAMHDYIDRKGRRKGGSPAEDEDASSHDPTENLGDLKHVMDKLGSLMPEKEAATA